MSDLHAPAREVLDQIAALAPGSGRPLVICDVDEVVFHMVRHLEVFLADRGLRFLRHAYQLTGNIGPVDGETPIGQDEVRRLLLGFFAEVSDRQDPVEGAADGLRALAEVGEVIFLTNLPGSANKPARERLLARHGMPYPVVTNAGPKGAAAAALSAGRGRPVVFIDDSPQNLKSVHASLPETHLVHFVADDRFRAAVEPLPMAGLLSGDWQETSRHILSILAGRQETR
ncbi:hypothetical protein [Pannonibacter tanglangensis]|uniref:Hydrolase of the HAD superfamily n=1 Tax=Pannonibacter tanglangensis TaxID=2750084 RepID=A0ABW9ZFY0_9HYPH|nr:hypothetical protein [Pannonibacter sp. XCT-34]NBN63754.1 hypothetical protein [Pannonibacter sp. XCT-34]